MKQRLVVITNGNYFARLILNDLFRHDAGQVAGVLIISGDYKARTGLAAAWHLARAMTLPYLTYKVLQSAIFSLAQRLYPHACLSVEQQASRLQLPVVSAVSVNSPETRSIVQSWAPDLIVSVSCPQLIQKKTLALARLGGINIHGSRLPAYAGLAPYYWVLSAGEAATGITVHYLAPKFDQGHILAQRRLTILPGESAFQLFSRLALAGSAALLEAIPLALSSAEGTPQELSKYSYFSHPDFKSYVSLRKRGHCLIRPGELITSLREEIRQPSTVSANTAQG